MPPTSSLLSKRTHHPSTEWALGDPEAYSDGRTKIEPAADSTYYGNKCTAPWEQREMRVRLIIIRLDLDRPKPWSPKLPRYIIHVWLPEATMAKLHKTTRYMSLAIIYNTPSLSVVCLVVARAVMVSSYPEPGKRKTLSQTKTRHGGKSYASSEHPFHRPN